MVNIKKIAVRKFSQGLLSFDEIVKIVGYEEARKIAFFVKVAKKSFEEGLR